MAKTKYVGVYIDNNGQYFYETELGTDRITGKRLRKKDVRTSKEESLLLLCKLIKNWYE